MESIRSWRPDILRPVEKIIPGLSLACLYSFFFILVILEKTFQFRFPLYPALILYFIFGVYSQLQSTKVVMRLIAVQILILLLWGLPHSEFFNLKYYGGFIIVPHFFMAMYFYLREQSRWTGFIIGYRILNILLLSLSFISLILSMKDLSSFSYLFSIEGLKHNSGLRDHILQMISFPDTLFGLKVGKTTSSLLSLYSFTNVFLCINRRPKKTWELISVAGSLILIAILHSRGIFVTLAIFAVIVSGFPFKKLLIPLLLAFPYVQFFLPPHVLNGRFEINWLFYYKRSFFGNGLGSSIVHMTELWAKFPQEVTDSFHNIHIEFAHTFGIPFYVAVIGIYYWFLLKQELHKSLLFLLVTNIMMATNFNLFNVYTPILFVSIIYYRYTQLEESDSMSYSGTDINKVNV